jgi:energy-coupling factor transport system ATP-binding protein
MPINLENVSYEYQSGITVLRDVSLHIEDGEFTGIMGHTGCGKTTLLQLIAGLLRPTQGRVTLDGKDINAANFDRRELREKLGIVFQFPSYQLFETTVEKDVAFGLKYSGLSSSEKNERVRWAL